MKFGVSVLLIAMLSYALCAFFPWWMIAVAAFIVSLFIKQSPVISFLSGFVALFLLWGILSFAIDYANDSILSARVSLLILKVESPALMIVLTAFIGAVVGGFAALAGSFVHKRV